MQDERNALGSSDAERDALTLELKPIAGNLYGMSPLDLG